MKVKIVMMDNTQFKAEVNDNSILELLNRLSEIPYSGLAYPDWYINTRYIAYIEKIGE